MTGAETSAAICLRVRGGTGETEEEGEDRNTDTVNIYTYRVKCVGV